MPCALMNSQTSPNLVLQPQTWQVLVRGVRYLLGL